MSNNGKLYENINGIMRPLDLTLEQVQATMEENKKMVELQQEYDRSLVMCQDLADEGKKLHAMISKARRELSFDPDEQQF